MMAKIAAWLLTHVILVIARKEADKAGVALFSESNALRVRRYLITRVLTWLTKFDQTKQGKTLNADNAVARFWEILWKSDTIGEELGKKPIREARKLLTDALAEFGKIEHLAVNGSVACLEWQKTVRQKIIAAGTILDAKDITLKP
jgi:hypothetical protein